LLRVYQLVNGAALFAFLLARLAAGEDATDVIRNPATRWK
jgi:hypothetical protein